MRYIKTYEGKKEKPKVGDYVICTDFTNIKPKEKEYIENTIGKLVDIAEGMTNPYTVYYENAPQIFTNFCFLGYDEIVKLDNCRWYDRKEILFFSPDKEECEAYLAVKKYNL